LFAFLLLFAFLKRPHHCHYVKIVLGGKRGLHATRFSNDWVGLEM